MLAQCEMTLVKELRLQGAEDLHKKYFRMSTNRFDSLLEKIAPEINHRATHRYPITNYRIPELNLLSILRRCRHRSPYFQNKILCVQ